MPDPPDIDSRTATEIEAETRDLLLRFIREDPDWPGTVPLDMERTGGLAALIAIFGRFAETLINRLNRSPQKNFLAFLDLLGISRLHPQPARVPLTFSLATGATHAAVVKAGTQVSAQPAKNENKPSIFETERELVVSPVRLVAAYMMDHGRDRYYSWRPASEDQPEKLDFAGVCPVEHHLYLGFGEALVTPEGGGVELRFALEKVVPGTRAIIWEVCIAERWQAAKVLADETQNLSRSGVIRFAAFPASLCKVNGVESHWVRATLTTPLEGPLEVPRICSIGLHVSGGKTDLPRTMAFSESQALDVTKDFFPFGARPAFGSTFYLGNAEAVSITDAETTIHVELTNPALGGPEPPIPRTSASGNPQLAWEIWNGASWVMFGISQTAAEKTAQFPAFEDSTMAFTRTGSVRFRLSEPAKAVVVNGTPLPWIRVRLVSGDYGTQAAVPPEAIHAERQALRAPLAPPSIRQVKFDYQLSRAVDTPERIFDFNDFKWTEQRIQSGCFDPFRSDKNLPLALYFGFEPPFGREHAFGKRSISLYALLNSTVAEVSDITPSVVWEFWDGSNWSKWTVRDETGGGTDSGAIRFLPPPGFSPRELFNQRIYWLRARWKGSESPARSLRTILMNTVMARNAESVPNEILGSSKGTVGQIFRTLRTPILDGPVLEVREPQRPSSSERLAIEKEAGADAIRTTINEWNAQSEIWVRWHEVTDFLESQPLARHYVVNHISGEISFGDNKRGMVPPAGSGNIQISYQTGGGAAGNRKAGEIVSLKTAIPYVAKVFNHEPAEGGVDAEDERELPIRGPKFLRHRNRAVTTWDYEDLAMLASPAVARARCFPATNLASRAERTSPLPGEVSVVIVPRSLDAKPLPTPTLLNDVKDYLNARKVPAAGLHVLGPDYLRIEVEVEIGLQSLDSGDVELAVILELQKYLHPLTGGPSGTGWQFGRRVRASELYKVVEPVPGVSYISRLEVTEHEEPWDLRITEIFLIYSGTHKVHLFLPQD